MKTRPRERESDGSIVEDQTVYLLAHLRELKKRKKKETSKVLLLFKTHYISFVQCVLIELLDGGFSLFT
jgi:hypothetical protein